jgi:hypothetical protein
LLISVPVHLGKCGEHAKLCAVGIQQLIDIPIIGQGGLSCVMTDRTLKGVWATYFIERIRLDRVSQLFFKPLH